MYILKPNKAKGGLLHYLKLTQSHQISLIFHINKICGTPDLYLTTPDLLLTTSDLLLTTPDLGKVK